MNVKSFVGVGIVLALCSACGASTYHYHEKSADGTWSRDVNQGPFHRHVEEEWDAEKQYRDCLSTVNRRQLGGLTADQYCRAQTRSSKRGGPNGSMFVPGMTMGTGYMPTSMGMSMAMPLYAAPRGQLDYEGTDSDPRSAAARVAHGTHLDAIEPVARQTAHTANRVQELEGRLERLETPEASEEAAGE